MRNFATILIAFLLLYTNHASAQFSDSLYKDLPDSLKPAHQHLPTAKEKNRIIRNISGVLTKKHSIELHRFAAEAEQALPSLKEPDIRVSYAASLAAFYVGAVEYYKALTYYGQVIEFAAGNKKYKDDVMEAYINRASIFGLDTKADSAMYGLGKALEMLEPKDSAFKSLVYSAYTLIYEHTDLFEEALESAKQNRDWLPAASKWQENYTLASLAIADNYATLYSITQKKTYMDSVIAQVQLILQGTGDNKKYWYSACQYQLGEVYYSDGQYEKAFNYYDAALIPEYIENNLFDFRLASKTKLKRLICRVQMGDKQAMDSLEKMVLNKSNFFANQYKFEALYQNASKRGDWKKAFDYYQSYIGYRDSIAVVSNKSKVLVANQKFSVAQKELQIKTLENNNLLEKQTKARVINIAVGIITAMLVIIALLYARNKRKETRQIKERQDLMNRLQSMGQEMELGYLQRQAEKEAAILSERKAISQNMHDEIGSSLTGLSYLIAHINRNMNKAGVVPVEMLNELEEEARQVYRQARDFMHMLNENTLTESYNVVELLHQLTQRFGQEYSLKISIDIDEKDINDYFKSQHHAEMYRVVKEAVTNSIKHSGATSIHIKLSYTDNQFYFDISDNGGGMKSSQTNGIGMAAMKQRIKALNGFLQVVTNNNGTHIMGQFPT